MSFLSNFFLVNKHSIKEASFPIFTFIYATLYFVFFWIISYGGSPILICLVLFYYNLDVMESSLIYVDKIVGGSITIMLEALFFL